MAADDQGDAQEFFGFASPWYDPDSTDDPNSADGPQYSPFYRYDHKSSAAVALQPLHGTRLPEQAAAKPASCGNIVNFPCRRPGRLARFLPFDRPPKCQKAPQRLAAIASHRFTSRAALRVFALALVTLGQHLAAIADDGGPCWQLRAANTMIHHRRQQPVRRNTE